MAETELVLDPAEQRFLYQGRPMHLEPMEYHLLRLFMNAPDRIVPPAQIRALWRGRKRAGAVGVVAALVHRLRRKLAAVGAGLITFHRRAGYRLRPADGPRLSIQFDPGRRQYALGNQPLRLSSLEARLLHHLAEGAPVSWGTLALRLHAADVARGRIDERIRSLRQKLAAAGEPDAIVCVRGVGYRLRAVVTPLAPRPNPALRIDRDAKDGVCATRRLGLSRLQLELLAMFLDAKGEVVSREEVLARLYTRRGHVRARTIDMHVLGLRHKILAAGGDPDAIESVPGVGYRLRPADQGGW